MSEFLDNRTIYESAKFGSYIIIPLKYEGTFDFCKINTVKTEELAFTSEDFSDLILRKCKPENGFVRRFRVNALRDAFAAFSKEISICDAQVIVFEKGIAFVALFAVYEKVEYMYRFVNPGYISSVYATDDKTLQQKLIEILFAELKYIFSDIFKIYVENKELLIKEAYLFNAGIVSKRFQNLETIKRVTFNLHKLTDLSEDFTDVSENDIYHTYGSKDINLGTYRWGCCISSQSISYVYAEEDFDNISTLQILKNTNDDFLLTLLVLYQKYKCILLNDTIYVNTNFKTIKTVKYNMIEFKAYGTLAPSQISRWNNVCETYQRLLDVCGVNEALEEIEDKIQLLSNEEERRTSQKENYIAMFIALFGLISIIADVLQIVDLMSSNNPIILFWFNISVGMIILSAFVILWFVSKKGR